MLEISRGGRTDMKIKTFAHFFSAGFKSMVRNRLMSVASIITVSAALFVFGIFMALILNVNNIEKSITSKIEIEGFLKSDYTLSQQHGIEGTIRSIKGVTEMKYVSKEQALEKFKGWLGADKSLADGLSIENPLDSSYIVKVDNPKSVASVSRSLKKLNVFKKINDANETVDKIIKYIDFAKIASIVLIIVLGIVSISLISNTIKLTVYARKKEIGIMKYIGATDWFIRWPFIIEGVTLGFVGAIISIFILWISYGYVSGLITKDIMIIPVVSTKELMDKLGVVFCLVGILIGGIGSTLSIRKFLVK